MRKRLTIVFCIILALSAIPAMQRAHAGSDDSSIVRVKLSVETGSSLSFFVDGNYTIGDSTAAIERQQYTVKLEGGSLNMYCGPSKIAGGSSIKLVQRAATSGRNNFIWVYNAHYESTLSYTGDMEFLIDAENACIKVVNHIYIEDYLYGVVRYEMSPSWPLEALKAQAVAARNYAAKRMGSAGAYDLTDDSSNDQVYKGYSASVSNATKAVDETAGQVLTYSGTIIDCYYSASNGGWTELPYHRWGGGRDWQYYAITADPYDVANPSSRFETITLPVVVDEAQPLMTSQTEGLSGTMNAANAIKLIKDAILKSNQLVSYGVDSVDDFKLTGITDLYTHTYDIGGSQDHSLTQDLDKNGSPDANLCVDKVRAMGAFTVSVGETVLTVADIDFDLERLKSDGDYPAFFAASLGLFVVETVTDESSTPTAYTLSMKRYGHGVGLSQRGAQQRANSTDESVKYYDQILGFYYPGTIITKLTYTRPSLTAAETITDHSNAYVKLTDGTPLNVRGGAGTSFSKLGTLPDIARIEVVQANAATGSGYTWHKILFAGQYAYVAANYVVPDDPQPAPQTCTVAFTANGGGTVSNWTGNHGASVSAAPAVSRGGYNFGGWYYDTGLTRQVSFPLIVTGDMTLYAKWAATASTVTFNAQGGSGVASVTKNYGDKIASSPATARPGYNFGGWYPTSACNTAAVSFPYTVSGSVTLYAKWTAQPQTAYLSGVKLSAGTLSKSFSKSSYNYKIALGENQDSVTITPFRENTSATMTINGKSVSSYTVSLKNGKSATVTVKVKFGKTTKSYKFTVTRAKSTNNNLATLTASAGKLNRAFNPAVTSYTLTLDQYTKSVKISDTVASSLASASFKSKTVSLSNGQTTKVTITVKAQSGAKKTYTITVTRAASTDTGLKYLKTNSGSYALTPSFSAGVTNYTVTLPASRNSVTISAKTTGYKATLYFDGAKKTSKKVTVASGQSLTVRVTVVAQAGNKKEYTITVRRQ